MWKFKQLIAFLMLSVSFFSNAQEQENNYSDGYISDDLFIYMHAGPGTNYRILGTVNAGTQIKVTGEADNGYAQIIDDKGRQTWIESKYISDKPGLRFVVAELNTQLANASDIEQNSNAQLSRAQETIADLREKNTQLNEHAAKLNNDLSEAQLALKSQDIDIQKEWFFNGAIVLFIGLLLGIVLPRISMKKRSSMDSWS